MFVKGCGDGPLFATACYAQCKDGACADPDTTCTKVTIDPCHNSMCDACGRPDELCLPK